MTEEWAAGPIDGVTQRSLPLHADPRGAFRELWRASWTDGLGTRFVQSNLSRSRAGALRGMHFHRRQADLWVVIEGRAVVALADLRPMRDGTAHKPPVATVDLTVGDALFLPEWVAHGFFAPEEMALIYFVTQEFDGSDELGFAWDDPQVGIPWPSRDVILSERDRSNPSLGEALAGISNGS
ncbi:MAG: dTDP-4-dehydrorhamnose 3,5-epimerase family protein [Chloroflexi bacterium]|nr:dTDP-4-dehydrorhamnose 3,5-epimerase family protein [Chloroflexota bacterium]